MLNYGQGHNKSKLTTFILNTEENLTEVWQHLIRSH